MVLPAPVARTRRRPRGGGVDLHLAIHDIDDPVNGNTGAGVDPALVGAVAGQGRVGHLDGEADVGGPGVARRVAVRVVADDGEVRLRLAFGQGDGGLDAQVPAGGQKRG